MTENKSAVGGNGAMALIVTTTYMGMYAGLWSVMTIADDKAMTHDYKLPTPFFDTCGTGWDYYDTKASVLIEFNTILMAILTLGTVFLLMGAMSKMALRVGMFIHGFGPCLTLALFIT